VKPSDSIQQLISNLDMPCTLRDVGIKREYLAEIARRALDYQPRTSQSSTDHIGERCIGDTGTLLLTLIPSHCEAKSKLSQLVEAAARREKVVIAKAGKPYIQLAPC